MLGNGNGHGGQPRHRRVEGQVIRAKVLGFEWIEFCAHSLARVAQRGVKVEDVINAINNPTKSGLKTQPGRKRIRWQKSARKSLDVVYVVSHDRIIVVTVYFSQQ